MKTKSSFLAILLVILFGIIITGCSKTETVKESPAIETGTEQNSNNQNVSTQQAEADSQTENLNKAADVVYTCTMHPEVISDKPGNCPKCGMNLVIKK